MASCRALNYATRTRFLPLSAALPIWVPLSDRPPDGFKMAAITAYLTLAEHLISEKKTSVFPSIPNKVSTVCLWLRSVHVI